MANTTPAKVRALLPTLLIDDDDLGVSHSGTNLVLNYPAFDVPSILKDGVSITAYTFERPDKVTLTSNAAGERYIARVHRGIEDTEIDNLIESSDRIIVTEFDGYDTPGSGYLEDWSGMLSASKYLKLYAIANEENIERAKTLSETVYDEMKAHKEKVGIDSSNIVVKVNS